MQNPASPLIHTSLSAKNRIATLCLVALALGPVSTLSATNRTWNGSAADGDFSNGANWVGGTAPANNDYGDTAIFDSSATAGIVNVPSSRSIVGITFSTAGWALTGSSFTNLTTLSSAGAGTNSLGMSLQLKQNATWTVSIGNTLTLAASFYERSYNVSLTGGGTLDIASSITGYSGTVGAWGINVGDATLRFDTATPYSSSCAGAVFITDAASRVQLLTSVSAASALIGGRIRDNLGNGLQVADIGGGYVEITATPIPEPSTGALILGAGSLGLIAARRMRRRG